MLLAPLRRSLELVHRRPGLALAIYWPVVFVGTHIPRLQQVRRPPRGLPLDKLAHFAGYAVLAWLLMLVFTRAARPATAITLTVLVIAAYGVVDELTQPLVNRTADIWDYLANLLGCAGGIGVALRTKRVEGRSE